MLTLCLLLSFRMMFWNVENLFDTRDDPLTLDEEFSSRGSRRWTSRRLEQKCLGLAKTIVSASGPESGAPLVVGLAEVENGYVLRKLTSCSVLNGLGYGFIHRDSPDPRGIDVALLYRRDGFMPIGVKAIRVEMEDSAATRDILYVKGLLRGAGDSGTGVEQFFWDRSAMFEGGDTLHLFVVHFPSKRGSGEASGGRRRKAAEVLLSAVDSILSASGDAAVAVMGDFNDGVEATRGLLPSLECRSEGVEGGTLKYRGRWETIDQFYTANISCGRMTVHSPPFLLEKDTKYLGMKPRRTYTGPRYNAGLSDHLPILLDAAMP